MILLIGAEKGGTGKTTLATNLAAIRAAEGKEVLLLDTDPQASATFWNEERDESEISPTITCIQKFGRIDNEAKKLAGKFDDIIIDAGGRDSKELRSSALVADKIYVPVQSSQFDIWSISGMEKIIDRATELNSKLRAYVVINRGATNPSISETDEAKEIMAELEHLKLSSVIIHERIAFRKAAKSGKAVTEMVAKDKKAITEIMNIYREIFDA